MGCCRVGVASPRNRVASPRNRVASPRNLTQETAFKFPVHFLLKVRRARASLSMTPDGAVCNISVAYQAQANDTLKARHIPLSVVAPDALSGALYLKRALPQDLHLDAY
eukprot:1039055-Rhodomonas_salina.1